MTRSVSHPVFPTPRHQRVAELACEFFADFAQVDTVLVVNSCARGQATPESDIDLAVLIDVGKAPREAIASPHATEDLEAAWAAFATGHALIREFQESGRFTLAHLDVFDGECVPAVWDEGGGPDTFEIEIGNRVAHSTPLRLSGPRFLELQARWLPYYGDDLRDRRLAMTRTACAYDLEHVPFFAGRGLHFQAFDRLYKAFQEFLQALFISRRIYPVAYNKWIREQVEGWLRLPDLYRELPPIISVGSVESADLLDRAAALRTLLDRWIPVTAETEDYFVRLALPGETAAVAAVERRAIRVFESHLIETGLTLEALARVDSADALDQAQREGRLWVALSARGELVGFALVCPMGGTANLEELDVLPEHARRGVGSRLLETVCAWAREVGYARVTLSTFRDIAWNAPFYARRGFRVVDPSTLSRAHVESVSAEKARGGRTDLRVVMEFKT